MPKVKALKKAGFRDRKTSLYSYKMTFLDPSGKTGMVNGSVLVGKEIQGQKHYGDIIKRIAQANGVPQDLATVEIHRV